MAKRLTALSVAAVRPRSGRFELADGSTGLRLVVQSSGHKSWCVRYRHANKTCKLTLGSVAALPLAGARLAAADALHRVAQGIDPAAARRAVKVASELADASTLRAVTENYLRFKEAEPADRRLRTLNQRRATFERLVFPVLGGRPIGEIKRSEVVKLMDRIQIERGGRAADAALEVLSVVFNWYAKRSDDFRTPLVRDMNLTKPKDRMRSRVLDDTELRKVWLACEDFYPFGCLVQFLVLCAARRNEATNMRWDEVKDGVWVIPGHRYKNGSDHVVPLSQAARDLLVKVPRIAGSAYVFTSTGVRPYSDPSGGKRELDRRSGVTGWVLHDLRRVARSLLSRAGIANDIAEMALGHTLGGLRAVYDQHKYIDEKRRAFEALAAQINLIVDPPTGNVVSMVRG